LYTVQFIELEIFIHIYSAKVTKLKDFQASNSKNLSKPYSAFKEFPIAGKLILFLMTFKKVWPPRVTIPDAQNIYRQITYSI